ncbi:MAG: aminopeptidase P family protein [Nitrospirae bacterium]|nr:aminopeptidase P family protein [Nitrospirota bacterium]
MIKEYDATLIISCSERDADLYYATRFLAPDQFIFLKVKSEKIMMMTDLELDRAKAQARVDSVLSLSEYEERAKKKGIPEPGIIDSLDLFLAERGIRSIQVPAGFPIRYADELRGRGYQLESKKEPFFEDRMVKSDEELGYIRDTQRKTEEAMGEAISVIRDSIVKGNLLYYKDDILTSDRIRRIIDYKLMDLKCIAEHTIVAVGTEGCDPHNEGSGPLRPHQPIIIDLFPRSTRTRYFADMTRTVVKGKTPDRLKKMYEAVISSQERGISLIRDGMDARIVHNNVSDCLKSFGFETGIINGRMQGFFHGTGHGIGLDVHEPPRISKAGYTLKKGNIVTVEPGLYYADIGGVRIEDMVLVTEEGCINLTTYPKTLEV